MLLSVANKSITIPDSFLLSLVGFAIVFLALIALIAVIKIISTLSMRKEAGDRQASEQSEGVSSVPVPVPAGLVPAPGSLGEIDLYSVDDHTAALIMAIVADKLNVPLNTLRFTSIRQIEEEK